MLCSFIRRHAWLALCAELLAVAAAPVPLRAEEGSVPGVEPIQTPGSEFDPYYSDQKGSLPWQPATPSWEYFGECWTEQLLPEGLVYRSYLAGPKEARISSNWFYERHQGWLWDATLGGRVGLYRYGSRNSYRPEGFQIDVEAAAFPRLDPEDERDLISADFRFGFPFTYGLGIFETKLAYYHLSSHLGDEFMLKHPHVERINYSRDAIVVGLAAWLTEDVRVYAETGYAVYNSGYSEPWEFQLGAEYSPAYPTLAHGAPFAAMNVLLREEVNFGGTFTAQAGWQWRGHGSRHLFRAGLQYLVGKSPQLEFYDQDERQFGLALWYDY